MLLPGISGKMLAIHRQIIIMNRLSAFIAAALFLSACQSKPVADMVIHNAVIYTVDSAFSIQQAMAIRDGKILATGSSADLLNSYEARQVIDAQGGAIYPGFIDAHAHFVGYALGLRTADLTGARSWEEVIDKLKSFLRQQDPGPWIIGRGWDQNTWPLKAFPDRKMLDELFPDKPVLLTRIDGHAAIANSKALEIAGLRPGDKVAGGEIETVSGRLTGVLVDNAVDRVTARIPAATADHFRQALQQAEKNCFATGLTTIDDCGLPFEDVEQIKELQQNGHLKMRLYVLLSDEKKNYDYLKKNGPVKTDRLQVRGFKVYGDGALGSRGACLLEPYKDKAGYHGFLLSNPAHFDSVAALAMLDGFQLCTHAIGDSGNRTILHTYGKYLTGKNDLRWRIEHAQVVNENDFSLFGRYSIIPSVQPTHATSDMYWAGDRLGSERLKGAYAYKRLLQQNGWLPLGTDFPVEDISPFKTFYAAVFRKDANAWPAGGFQPENALSREEALRGMTIWVAMANFEEKEKGSLEKGKWADFIILDKDLMKADEKDILRTQVLQTYIGGEKVYSRP